MLELPEALGGWTRIALRRLCLPMIALALLPCLELQAQMLSYPDPCLDYVFPAGAQQGQTVAVELGGPNGLGGATKILIDGPPGITVTDVVPVDAARVTAKFHIAADAAPGRRRVRVLGGTNGLTNFRWFFVGRLPEVVETEPNNTPELAQQVPTPAVVNARIAATLDEDCFRFNGKAGQKIVAAIQAHGMDSRLRQSFNLGYLDTSLELMDSAGQVLAAADDTSGLDPILEHTIAADGQYTVRIRSLAFKGSPGCVYRLTLGDVPYPTAVFPAGGQRGTTVDFELSGVNMPSPARQALALPATSPMAVEQISLEGLTQGVAELPLLTGEAPEQNEQEPNDAAAAAATIPMPITLNGRFDKAGDEDWFQFSLEAGQGALIQTAADRHLRSPVDTVLELYDEQGTKLADNDDGRIFWAQVAHDFESSDSWLPFTAKAAGTYRIRVRDQSAAAGPRAIYRLTVEPLKPDFRLFQWPDAVPVWGAGSTASFVVQLFHWGGMQSDAKLRIEGLAPGWTGSAGMMSANYYTPIGHPYGAQVLLTITAPPGAVLGDVTPFRVVGVIEQDGQTIERVAQPLTLYGNSHNDRMFLRYSDQSRAAVAPPQDCRLETSITELTAVHGSTVEIPVRVHRREGVKADIALSIDGATPGVGCGWRTPMPIGDQSELLVPLPINPEWRPGTYPIVVSRSWAADLRAGRPGPCTPVILLTIEAKKAGR